MFKQENCFLLQRFSSVIEGLTDSQYVLADQPLFQSSIGAHARHVLDHYQAFLDGLQSESGHIDYDARARESAIETDRNIAIDKFTTMIGHIEKIDDYQQVFSVSMDVGHLHASEIIPQSSTVGRELTFLHSHTIHHEALVSFILRVLNVPTTIDDIGFAPSTIKHKENL